MNFEADRNGGIVVAEDETRLSLSECGGLVVDAQTAGGGVVVYTCSYFLRSPLSGRTKVSSAYSR